MIWKDYSWRENIIKKDLKPRLAHEVLCTYSTPPFIARDSLTRKQRSFDYQLKTSGVFEGFDFGLKPGDDVTVRICEGEVIMQNRQGR